MTDDPLAASSTQNGAPPGTSARLSHHADRTLGLSICRNFGEAVFSKADPTASLKLPKTFER